MGPTTQVVGPFSWAPSVIDKSLLSWTHFFEKICSDERFSVHVNGLLLATTLLFFATSARADDPLQLHFPVDCALGETCMIQQAMDRDHGPEARDFRCGPQTYDEHQGTDIRLPDLEALAQNVPVLAAAPGTVLGVRNSVPDTGIGGFPEGQDCGNGVVLDHGNGWQTQYCHLAQGSVSVVSGDTVNARQPIGTIGFSGRTEFPHLHLSVRENGAHVDPFDPAQTDTCAIDGPSLWIDDITLPAGGILSAGFASAVPDFADIRAGTADAETLPSDGDALVLWGFFYGARDGDMATLTIAAPDGTEWHTQSVDLDRTQAQLFRASGRRIRAPLDPGLYTGTVTLIRDGQALDTLEISIPVT